MGGRGGDGPSLTTGPSPCARILCCFLFIVRHAFAGEAGPNGGPLSLTDRVTGRAGCRSTTAGAPASSAAMVCYRHAPRRARRRGVAAVTATTAAAAAAATAAAVTGIVAFTGVAATPALRVAPNFPAGAPPEVSVVAHPALWAPPRTAAAARSGALDAGGTAAAAVAEAEAVVETEAAAGALAPSTNRRFVPSDLAATYSVVDRPAGAFRRSACPASSLRHERIYRRGVNPDVYDVPHAFMFMDGEPCGRAQDLARGRNMTLVAASVLTSAAAAAAAGVPAVWDAVQGRPSMAQMLRYTGDARDVYVGWERHNRKCGRGHTYRKGTLFFFIASDTRALSGVGVTFDRAQPFVVSFNPAVCVLAAPARAAATRAPQDGSGGAGATPSVLPAAPSPAGVPSKPSAAPGAVSATPLPAATSLVDAPAPTPGMPAGAPATPTKAPVANGATPLPAAGTPAAGTPAAGMPAAGVPTASPPAGPRPGTGAEEAAPPAVDGAAVGTATPRPSPLPAAAAGGARDSGDGGGACFPATARVTLADGRVVPMAALRLGDEVVSRPGGETSAVYLFTHRQPGGLHDFLRITATPVAGSGSTPTAVAQNRTLTLSAGHYVYASVAATGGGGGLARLVTARTLRAGDRLRDAGGAVLVVVSVLPVTAAGLYNPHTLDGGLVVDGVHVSCLTAAVAPWLARALLAPLGWAWRARVGRGGLWGALHHSPPQPVLALLPGGGNTVEL